MGLPEGLRRLLQPERHHQRSRGTADSPPSPGNRKDGTGKSDSCQRPGTQRPRYTLNTLARACLAGKELTDNEPAEPRPCPFLNRHCCTIYPVRPFACRSFHSLVRCRTDRPALVNSSHLAAATALNQLLEHLCQRQPWGNLLDVLPQLQHDSSLPDHALRAQPLPGLMLGPDDYPGVAPLVERILASSVNGRSVEAVLNGR
jgi:hypothetical protein